MINNIITSGIKFEYCKHIKENPNLRYDNSISLHLDNQETLYFMCKLCYQSMVFKLIKEIIDEYVMQYMRMQNKWTKN